MWVCVCVCVCVCEIERVRETERERERERERDFIFKTNDIDATNNENLLLNSKRKLVLSSSILIKQSWLSRYLLIYFPEMDLLASFSEMLLFCYILREITLPFFLRWYRDA